MTKSDALAEKACRWRFSSCSKIPPSASSTQTTDGMEGMTKRSAASVDRGRRSAAASVLLVLALAALVSPEVLRWSS